MGDDISYKYLFYGMFFIIAMCASFCAFTDGGSEGWGLP